MCGQGAREIWLRFALDSLCGSHHPWRREKDLTKQCPFPQQGLGRGRRSGEMPKAHPSLHRPFVLFPSAHVQMLC